MYLLIFFFFFCIVLVHFACFLNNQFIDWLLQYYVGCIYITLHITEYCCMWSDLYIIHYTIHTLFILTYFFMHCSAPAPCITTWSLNSSCILVVVQLFCTGFCFPFNKLLIICQYFIMCPKPCEEMFYTSMPHIEVTQDQAYVSLGRVLNLGLL